MIKVQTSQLFIIISWNMDELYTLLDILEFVFLLTGLVVVDMQAYQLPLSWSYYWSLFTAYIHTISCFTSNSKFLCIFLCRFYAPLLRCYILSPPGIFILHFLSSLLHAITNFL